MNDVTPPHIFIAWSLIKQGILILLDIIISSYPCTKLQEINVQKYTENAPMSSNNRVAAHLRLTVSDGVTGRTVLTRHRHYISVTLRESEDTQILSQI